MKHLCTTKRLFGKSFVNFYGYLKGGFFLKVNFLDWFHPHLNFPAKMTSNFSLKLTFWLIKFSWNWDFARLKLWKIHHFKFGILWNMPFSSNSVSRFWRENSNTVKITKESLTFKKNLPLSILIFFFFEMFPAVFVSVIL